MRLRAFGTVRIEGAPQTMGGAAGQRRPLALLLLVAAAGDRGVTRDKAMGLLWPDSDVEHARAALRQTLSSLRRDLEAPELFVGAADLRLNAAILPSDLTEFDAAIASRDWERAVELYDGSLADGFFLNKSPEFERWLDDERRLRGQHFAKAIEALARDAIRAGDAVRAAAFWRKLATHDRLSARVAMELMRALAATGDRAAAIQHGRAYDAIVRAELDSEPDAAVARLADELRREAETSATAKSAALASSSRASHAMADARRSDPVLPTLGSSTASLLPADGSETAGAPSLVQADNRALATGVADAVNAEAIYQIPPSRRPLMSSMMRLTRTRYFRVVLLVAFAAGLATAVTVRDGDGSGSPALDSSLYLVLPFRAVGTEADIGLAGDQAERMLYEAISRWDDVRPVDAMRVGDFLARDGLPKDLPEALAVARSFRARYLAWGTLSRFRDSVRVQAFLYDAAQSDSTRSATTHLAVNLDGIEVRFRQLADSLLLGRGRTQASVTGGDIGTTRLAARRAYDRGHSALGQWKLAEAANDFRAAAARDAEFAQAWFWLAQVSSWLREDSTGEGRRAALRAAELRQRLSPRDQVAAAALAALVADQHPMACARYRELLMRDSTDFAAWYGLGECQALDSVVVEDPQSSSGRSFRASYHGASTAYARALDLVPSFNLAFRDRAYARLTSLFFTSPLRVRYGIEVRGGDTLIVAAWPSLQTDTLAFVPYPIDVFRAGDPRTRAPTRAQALAHNRLRVRRVAETWASTFSTSPDALEALALALEGAGEIATAAGRQGALPTIRRARAVAPPADSDAALRLAAAEVGLLVKVDSLRRARELADSILASSTSPSAAQDTILAALAALTGRVSRTASLLAQSATLYAAVTPRAEPVAVPLPVKAAARKLVGFAAFGGPPDSLRICEARLERLVRAHVDPQTQPRVRSAVLYVPLRLAYGALSARTSLPPHVGEDRLIRLFQTLERGDRAAVRSQLDAITARRASFAAGELSPEVVFQEIAIRTHIGDTAAAVVALDQMLEALPIMTAPGVRHPLGAAALVRGMALRAELAASARDASTAQRWSRAVIALWSGADPSLQPLIARMRVIAGTTS